MGIMIMPINLDDSGYIFFEFYGYKILTCKYILNTDRKYGKTVKKF